MREKIPDLFERHGLDDDTFMEKHVLPRLNANLVRVFRSEDKVIYSKPLEDNATRMAATRLVAEMKGMLVKEQDAPGQQVKVIVVNQAYRPRRPEHAKVISVVPGLGAPLEQKA